MRLSYCVQEVKHEIVQKNFRLSYCVQEEKVRCVTVLKVIREIKLLCKGRKGEMCDCVLKVIHEIKLLCTGRKS